jgi:hypothetical protein
MTGIELVSAASMSSLFGTAGAAAGTAGYVGALTLGDVMMGAGALLGTTSALSSSRQMAASSKYNAALAETQAQYAQQQAQADANAQKEKDRKLMAAQRARMAAGGLDMTSGSPLVVLENTASEADADYRNILANGQMQANYYRSQGALDSLQGSSALTSGWLTAGSTALSGTTALGSARSNREFRLATANAYMGNSGAGFP